MILLRKPNLQSIDLNLLRVFDALEQERSVTGAGKRLNITQSAISHSLNRLRHLLNDELFVRNPDGMIPTPRAIEIAPRLHEALMQIIFALDPPEFIPASACHEFTIACHSHTSTVLLPRVMTRLRNDAPDVTLHVQSLKLGIVSDLDAGRVDLAIGDFRNCPDRLGLEALMTDKMVWAIRGDHPLVDDELTVDTLLALPHVVLASAEQSRVTSDGFIVEDGLERRVVRTDDEWLNDEHVSPHRERMIRMSVPDTPTALAVVSVTDMATLVPLRVALALTGSYRVRLFNPPYASAPSQTIVVWHRTYGEQPANIWLRSVMREEALSLQIDGNSVSPEPIQPKAKLAR
jgi:DNA-binding transcriptional LysR family regulator